MMKSIKLGMLSISLLWSSNLFAQQQNLALGRPVTANSENPAFLAKNIVDGKITRNAKWMSNDVKPPHIVEINFPKYVNINQITIHTGIPEQEKTPIEMNKAAGFWSAKNFKLQYWDDANWTDIPNTEVHENRLTAVNFTFSNPINTFRLRLVCDDGEPISIMEFEVFGTETNNQAPSLHTQALVKKSVRKTNQHIKLRIDTTVIGQTMKYVGYNQGYYMPGSNASGWLEYAGVNSLRVWTTLNTYAPLNAVQVDPKLNSIIEFDRRKDELRAKPEHNPYLKWETLLAIYNNADHVNNTNPMVLSYALTELKRLNIEPIIQIGNTDFKDTWSNKWQQWQRFYALAYYMAKTGDVQMFAMQNEPNHRLSGMNLNQWIEGIKIVSDAVHSAIEDVNKNYNKKLTAKIVGPVTAGNNPEWWIAVMKAVRTDYHGKAMDHDLIQIFSTHSYNSPAAGYLHRVNDIRKIISENHPLQKELPIVYTEIGRWMNAYLIDKEETMDSPSLFTEWAGIYTNNTLNHTYGMWAFKFSNTSSDVYTQGVKSGHHFTWQGKRIVEDALINLAAGKPVATYNHTNGSKITDGIKTEASFWMAESSAASKWIEIDLKTKQTLASAIIYTGTAGGIYTAPDRVKSFKLQYLKDGTWKDIPGANVKDNKFAQLLLNFKQTVQTTKLRFWSDDPGTLKIREIKLFDKQELPDSNKNYDISGIQRTGQVVRLFAKGFKNERPLLRTQSDVLDENFDALSAYDPISKNYYVWLVQRGDYKNQIQIDLSALKIDLHAPIAAAVVNTNYYGEVAQIYNVDANGKLNLTLNNQSVMLLTIPSSKLQLKALKPSADASVRAGKYNSQNYGSLPHLTVQLNAAEVSNNQVGYIQFESKDFTHTKRAFLKIKGAINEPNSWYRIHVYAVADTAWKENDMKWDTAIQLNPTEALITGVGTKTFVAGELVFTAKDQTHILEVTDIIKDHVKSAVTFILVRETRQMGDDLDKHKILKIWSRETAASPLLELWK